jgi:glutamate 5-kinase
MLPDFITKKVSNKIIFAMFTLMSLSSIAVMISTATKIHTDSIKTTKKNLNMLNVAMFQSLRNAMNTGDPAQIEKAENEARKIKGVKKWLTHSSTFAKGSVVANNGAVNALMCKNATSLLTVGIEKVEGFFEYIFAQK